MNSTFSLRLPENMAKAIDRLAKNMERSKTFLVKKAIKQYLKEYADYQIALDRLKNKEDKILSSMELKKSIGL